ncbi:hypothetical protein LC593_02430 [Nostoc sp. CHAB 5844]|nr:hypothetical protein [Nostoc sp. CHAB 5844]
MTTVARLSGNPFGSCVTVGKAAQRTASPRHCLLYAGKPVHRSGSLLTFALLY